MNALRHGLATLPLVLATAPLAAGEAPHDHEQVERSATEPGAYTPVPALTDADRAAAMPPAGGHPAHDDASHYFVLVDQFEVMEADPGTGFGWDLEGWIGTDLNRLRLRSDGERSDGRFSAASVELLYGRGIARWWDLVAGVRRDFRPGDGRTLGALGIRGLAPQNIELEATAHAGDGQTAARLEAGYHLLFTNRLVLHSTIELDFFGHDDVSRGVASGLATAEAGLRLRFEFTRRIAPYVGVAYEHAFGGTADLRRDAAARVGETRVVAGLRTWF